jgi:hypothetical protein
MGGGGGPTNSTVTQSNVPDWLRPQVENVLMGAGKNLFQTKKVDSGQKDESGNVIYNEEITGTKPFVPYSSDPSKYVAGFSPLQQQVQYNAANLQMPGQFNQATGYANAAAQGGLDTARQAAGYGNAGFQSGQMGQQLGIQGGARFGEMGAQAGLQGQQSGLLGQQIGTQGGQYYGGMGAGYGQQAADIGQMGLRAEQYGRDVSGQAENYARQAAGAGQNYAAQMTNPYAVQQYMNPYQSAVTDVQIQGAQRQADIARTQRGAQAARAGAFGGSRQAIENAEANRALASQMDAIRAQGQQTAYDRAIQSMQYGSNLGLQGLSGAQQGLGTALQGGQLGLSGIGTALQGLQGGMQGAGVGLQGVNAQLAGTAQGMQGAQSAMQGAGVGLSGVDRQLAGTGQGMQGAQVGLQGVSGQQAGYGLANQAAGTLGSLGTQQLGAQTGILGLQNQIGGQQQGQQQQIINQAIQNYAQAQEAPMTAFNQYNALLRGYAVPGTTTTQYQAQPTFGNQLAGFGTAGISALALNNAMSGGAAAGSDIRVKENIERIGTLANGLGLYDFEYKPEFKDHPQCGHGRFRGVMAQEVEKLIPEAVVTMDNGYKAVKYNLVEMELS